MNRKNLAYTTIVDRIASSQISGIKIMAALMGGAAYNTDNIDSDSISPQIVASDVDNCCCPSWFSNSEGFLSRSSPGQTS